MTDPTLLDRIERILRGEPVAATAGLIPACYGPRATADDVYHAWAVMHERMQPRDEAFYLAGMTGWASR